MDIRFAEYMSEISPEADPEDVIEDAKADTWQSRREHALVLVETGQLIMIRGGADGIRFQLNEKDRPIIEADGQIFEIKSLAWHTHPRPTGPSDHDFDILRRLGQASSVVYEMYSDGLGTRYYQKVRGASS